MKAIIIDDEKQARISLSLLLKEYCPEIEIVTDCENLPEGVKAIRRHKPDVIFLDIEMPGHSGLELLDFFDEKEVSFAIIFTTAYNEFAVQAFKLSALDYLLKPIIPDELVASVSRLKKQKRDQFSILYENIHSEKLDKIAIPSGTDLLLLNIGDILYIKGEGPYSEVFMTDATKYLVSRSLKNFEDVLQNDRRFLRIHRSYIANFDEAVSYSKSDGGWLNLKNGISIPVSPEKAGLIMEKTTVVKR
ncbi:two-component system LytT family response regulator [Chryseobacterium defluvii]|uniref:Two-component system LytT family response regulator n=1 Tax=Chryseobacterium defluvii TaxID=160396 RepID=A0A840KJ33_9FLAO|nr:LytTR family DNA-binding domain-containing protein [Chryseobacterium defluvii]MBB4807513.1 two-component system LytT family response regulator [Chryseobacterium defluvii]